MIKILTIIIPLFYISTLSARGCIKHLDSIIKHSTFCDRIEIIENSNGYLFVRSHTDSLIYKVHTELPSNNGKEKKSKREYFLIRSNSTTIIGEIIDDWVLFDRLTSFRTCELKFNPSIGHLNIENQPKRQFRYGYEEKKEYERKCVGKYCSGVIHYPLNIFKIKTPSKSWTKHNIQLNKSPYGLQTHKRYKFKKHKNHYINDSIHVIIQEDTIKTTISIRFLFDMNKLSFYQKPNPTIANILESIKLDSDKIIEHSLHSTNNDWGEYIYSNNTYQLVTITDGYNLKYGEIYVIDLYE